MATTTASGIIWQPVTNFAATLDWYRINLEDLVVTESAYDLLLREWQCDNGVLEGSSQLCADVRSRITRNGFGAVEHVTVQPLNQDSMEREGVDLRANFTYESEKLGQFSASLFYSKVLKFELNSFEGDEAIDLRYGWQGQSTPENAMSVTLGWNNPISAGKACGCVAVRAPRWRCVQLLANAVPEADLRREPDRAVPVQCQGRGRLDLATTCCTPSRRTLAAASGRTTGRTCRTPARSGARPTCR